MSKSPLLKVADAWVNLGGRDVLRRASLELQPRQSLGLLGPSGSGKSTLLRAIAGLHPLSRGTIELASSAVNGSRAFQVQMVFQDPYASLHPRHNAVFTL